ncbi:MAG TPA: glycosyltransferase [Candidatus Eisenbacteria bacterium]|jgi:trehalose synthase|nr:glycosyltransferase [Candidatus Eisenbacteria bacterium]
MSLLEQYAAVAGEEVVDQLMQLGSKVKGARVMHVNSTKKGGGVAEILDRLVPLMQEVGVDAEWDIIDGPEEFYECTKGFHNALQGQHVSIPASRLRAYEQANERAAERLRPQLEAADFVFIHDPQPARLLALCPGRKGKWIWRCHIDISRPFLPVWKYLRRVLAGYDASIFSLSDFAQPLPFPLYLIPPSIDPLSDKNRELTRQEVEAVVSEFDLDPDRPMVLQVSRFDRFKDPVGVIEAYRFAKPYVPGLQLVLAGGTASDDPEGEVVLREVQIAAEEDPDIHILLLPPDAHRTINALQRAATIVIQKSLREGFGLTVTEGLWKGKPVVGGNTGGIRLQVVNHHTGFLVSSPEGAALRIRYLLKNAVERQEMGKKARAFVRENFLLTRQLREYLTLLVGLGHGQTERIELLG